MPEKEYWTLKRRRDVHRLSQSPAVMTDKAQRKTKILQFLAIQLMKLFTTDRQKNGKKSHFNKLEREHVL